MVTVVGHQSLMMNISSTTPLMFVMIMVVVVVMIVMTIKLISSVSQQNRNRMPQPLNPKQWHVPLSRHVPGPFLFLCNGDGTISHFDQFLIGLFFDFSKGCGGIWRRGESFAGKWRKYGGGWRRFFFLLVLLQILPTSSSWFFLCAVAAAGASCWFLLVSIMILHGGWCMECIFIDVVFRCHFFEMSSQIRLAWSIDNRVFYAVLLLVCFAMRCGYYFVSDRTTDSQSVSQVL